MALLLGAIALVALALGGYFLVQTGRVSTQRVLSIVGLGTGEISIANLSDAPITVAVAAFDEKTGAWAPPSTLNAAPTEIHGVMGLNPGRYQITITAPGPQSGTCTVRIASGDIFRIVAVRNGTAVARERPLPFLGGQAEDINLATSPLCKQ